MNKGIFITGTGTDVGKTYVTALLIKKLRALGVDAGYYKAAVSGAESLSESDAGYVSRVAGFNQQEDSLLSYLYQTAVSPHLAAKLEGNPAELAKIIADFRRARREHSFVVMEGSGGIVCPIRYDTSATLMLEDIIKALNLAVCVVADAGLGTINAAVLTVSYLRQKEIPVHGILLNHYEGGVMQEDNRLMIERLTGVPVLACVSGGATSIHLDMAALQKITGGYLQ